MKVGDIVKEKRGPGLGIIVGVYRGDRVVRSGIVGDEPYTFIEVLYSDGVLFKHSSSAYSVMLELWSRGDK